jgi:hypothetical protein
MSAVDEVLFCLSKQPQSDGLFEVVKKREKAKSVELFFRVLRSDNDFAEWKLLMLTVLKVLKDTKARTFVGTSYFLREDTLVFGWVICFYGTDSYDDFLVPMKEYFGVSLVQAVSVQQVGFTAPPRRQAPRPPSVKGPSYTPDEVPLSQPLEGYNPVTKKGARPLKAT